MGLLLYYRIVPSAMADLGGVLPAPPYGPKFLQFHGVFQKMYKCIGSAPPRVGALSYDKSWIRPCSASEDRVPSVIKQAQLYK